MSVFVDSSALVALLDARDTNHARAAGFVQAHGFQGLVTHSYVVVESVAVAQRAFGAAGARVLLNELLPPIELHSVDDRLHHLAVTAFLAGLNRRLSLVDRVSLEFMRRERMVRCLAFDRQFAREGFELVA